MASNEGNERWRAEPEVSASGGHMPPSTGGGLFDPLNQPLPSEGGRVSKPTRATAPSDAPARTEAMAAQVPGGATQPARGGRRDARRRPALRRVRRTIRHVDPFSVLKLSLFFYAIALLLWLAFLAVLYSVVSGAGVFDRVSEFCKDLVIDSCSDPLTLGTVERWGLVIGFVMAIGGSLLNTIMAFLYNVGADLLGGLELTFVEREP